MTKLFKDTVDARIKSTPEFALALIEEQRGEIERLTAIETAAQDIVRTWQYEKNPNEYKHQDYRRVRWHRIEALDRALAAKAVDQLDGGEG